MEESTDMARNNLSRANFAKNWDETEEDFDENWNRRSPAESLTSTIRYQKPVLASYSGYFQLMPSFRRQSSFGREIFVA